MFIERGKGCYVWDVDGNKYIDYPLALGPITLGYGYGRIDRAVKKQLDSGIVFSQPHRYERELAEMLSEIIPCCEMVRFAKNGSDATSGAVRVARAYTGRDIVACCGYHGWQDWYIGTTTRNAGIPESVKSLTKVFEYNNIDSLEKIFNENPDRVAAVIMEPIGVAEPVEGFLRKVRELTRRHGAVLIFDEIVTGFRLALGGAQEYYAVVPDLACFGKGMANGFPISAVCGKKEIMRLFDEVFFSFTFGGETLSLVASIETISEMKEKRVIDHLHRIGRMLRDGYNKLARQHGLDKYTKAVGYPSHFVTTFTKGKDDFLEMRSLMHQEMVNEGILTIGSYNFSYSHQEKEIEYTLNVIDKAMLVVKKALAEGDFSKYIKGKKVESVFKRA